jgi:hypothetical protein
MNGRTWEGAKMSKTEREEESIEQKILKILVQQHKQAQHKFSDKATEEEQINDFLNNYPPSASYLSLQIAALLDLQANRASLSPDQQQTKWNKVWRYEKKYFEFQEEEYKRSNLTEIDLHVEEEIKQIVFLAKKGYYKGQFMQSEAFAQKFKNVLWNIYREPANNKEFQIQRQISDTNILFHQDLDKVKNIIGYIHTQYHYTIMDTLAQTRNTFESLRTVKDNDKMTLIQKMQAVIDHRRQLYTLMQEPQRHQFLLQCCNIFGEDFLWDWQAHALCNAQFFQPTSKFDERKMHKKECTVMTYTSLQGEKTRIVARQLNEFRKGLRKYPDKYEVIKPAKPNTENYRIKVL